jgi:hypothetical protein
MTMLVQGGLMVALTAVVGYGIWEIHRWGTLLGRETVSPKQRLLRVLGLFFLLLVLALWLRGTSYAPSPRSLSRLLAGNRTCCFTPASPGIIGRPRKPAPGLGRSPSPA